MIREFVATDRNAVHRYARDPDVVRHMDWGPNTPEDTTRALDEMMAFQVEDPRRHFELAVTLGEGGRLVGACGIRIDQPEHAGGSLGYVLERSVWGRGYGTEAAVALLGFGFSHLGLHRIVATCDTRNLASVRVMEKAGMRREGHFLHDRRQKGEWRDTFLYAALRNEWTAR